MQPCESFDPNEGHSNKGVNEHQVSVKSSDIDPPSRLSRRSAPSEWNASWGHGFSPIGRIPIKLALPVGWYRFCSD